MTSMDGSVVALMRDNVCLDTPAHILPISLVRCWSVHTCETYTGCGLHTRLAYTDWKLQPFTKASQNIPDVPRRVHSHTEPHRTSQSHKEFTRSTQSWTYSLGLWTYNFGGLTDFYHSQSELYRTNQSHAEPAKAIQNLPDLPNLGLTAFGFTIFD